MNFWKMRLNIGTDVINSVVMGVLGKQKAFFMKKIDKY